MTTPDRQRYIVRLECGHERRTEFPPLGTSYPCGEEPCRSARRSVASTTDTVTNVTTTWEKENP